jgi:predicted acetyltransferase
MVRPMTPEIRRIRDDEVPAFVESMSAGFLERPDVEKVAEQAKPFWDLDRTWAAFDVDKIVGTFRTWATELTVPGCARISGAAVTNVTVLPTHRRRGILSAMVAAEHEAIRERGEAVGLLWASEYPIYGRFGYGPACRDTILSIDTKRTSFHGEPTGRVELVKPDATSRDAIKAVFEAWRVRQPGEIRRREFGWDFDLGLIESAWDPRWKGFLALHRDGGGDVDGYVRYRTEGKWEKRQPHNVVNVDELHALTDEAYKALWRFLSDIDWVTTVKAERRSPSERLPWLLTNARAATPSDPGETIWVRLFDIPRALEARTYEREGSIVLEILDPEAPGGRARVHLEAGPRGATARPTKRSPELTLDVSALGAAYLGGARLRDAVVARGVDEHRAGALASATALLRTLDEPWCSTFF